jgi:hypothetical protein
MGEDRDDGLSQAARCLAAMDGQDEETRFSLWRAAAKYAARDRTSRTGGLEISRPALARMPGVRGARVGVE